MSHKLGAECLRAIAERMDAIERQLAPAFNTVEVWLEQGDFSGVTGVRGVVQRGDRFLDIRGDDMLDGHNITWDRWCEFESGNEIAPEDAETLNLPVKNESTTTINWD
jgi:hypothetical protein